MNSSYNFLGSQRLLIKPFKRLVFIIIFILATVLSHILSHWFSEQISLNTISENLPIQRVILYGGTTGVIVGFTQWLILRRYIPDFKWVLVTTATSLFGSTTQAMIRASAELFVSSNKSFNNQEYIIFGLFSWLFGIGIYLIIGWLQWYVISRYVEKARWWIFIPILALVIYSLFIIPTYLFYSHISFNLTILSLSILPGIQAIGFCLLQKKVVHEHPVFQSPLALAADITDYLEIQKIQRFLNQRISKIWRTDLGESLKPMKYLVGVNSTCTQIVYEPMNQAAIDCVNQTPLPDLAGRFSPQDIDVESLPNLAKFKAVFSPPVSVKIYSFRGVPLLWLGLFVGITIVGISLLLGWFPIDLLPITNTR